MSKKENLMIILDDNILNIENIIRKCLDKFNIYFMSSINISDLDRYNIWIFDDKDNKNFISVKIISINLDSKVFTIINPNNFEEVISKNVSDIQKLKTEYYDDAFSKIINFYKNGYNIIKIDNETIIKKDEDIKMKKPVNSDIKKTIKAIVKSIQLNSQDDLINKKGQQLSFEDCIDRLIYYLYEDNKDNFEIISDLVIFSSPNNNIKNQILVKCISDVMVEQEKLNKKKAIELVWIDETLYLDDITNEIITNIIKTIKNFNNSHYRF